jgi:hypothetical protein
MRRPLAIFGTGLAIAACVVGCCAGGAAASTHFGGTISFSDTLCGFSGITTFSTEDNFGSLANGGSYDNGRFVQTFVADNGRGVEIDYSGGRGVFSPPVSNMDGTFTQILTASGLDVLTKAVNGPVLEHGAGRVQVTSILDAEGNTISVSAVALSGNQPNLSGAPDCSVITPYLAG